MSDRNPELDPDRDDLDLQPLDREPQTSPDDPADPQTNPDDEPEQE